MHKIGVGFAVCFAAMMSMVALAQNAADISAGARKQGMAKAPELIKATGIACTVADAREVSDAPKAGSDPGTRTYDSNSSSDGLSRLNSSGSGTDTPSPLFDITTIPNATASSHYYEVACTQGLGYLINAAAKKPTTYLCIEVPKGEAITQCLLPANSEAAELQFVSSEFTKAQVDCQAQRVRGMGHNAQAIVIEAACSSGDGYVLQLPNPLSADSAAHAQNCLGLAPATGLSCKLTDTVAQIAAADALLHQAQPACQTTAQRFVGMSTKGNRYFEFACQGGQGYMLSQAKSGEVLAVMACGDSAVANLGGCKLQSTRTP